MTGWQACQNVSTGRNFASFSQLLAAYFTLDFTMSPLADMGTWHLPPATPDMLPTATKHFDRAGLDNSFLPYLDSVQIPTVTSSTLTTSEDLKPHKFSPANCYCVVPENIHTPQRRELEIPEGWGSQKPRKFQKGGGVDSQINFQMAQFDSVPT